jgi:hypothetical protein
MSEWPEGGCPDCNGLEVDCLRCNGTGYLLESELEEASTPEQISPPPCPGPHGLRT